ncbi:MAG TPA: IclR family transcriptional regulator [Xanthobacteraceae bacterium]
MMAGNVSKSLSEKSLGEKSLGKTDGVAAVDRALAVLRAFGAGDRTLTLAELAARTKIYKSTILRLAQSLIRAGLLLRLADGRFRLGPEALRLGGLYQQAYEVADVILPVLRALREKTGESVIFHIREGERRICLHRVESVQAIRYHVREGDVLPLERGSGGRVLLAFSGAKGEPYETIRRQLHHISFGDRNPEVSGLAAPVFGPGQALVGAVTISGPRARLDAAAARRCVPILMKAVAQATRDLGGDARIFDARVSKTGTAATGGRKRKAR